MDNLNVFNNNEESVEEVSSTKYIKDKEENKTYVLSHMQAVDNRIAREFAKEKKFKNKWLPCL